MSNQRIIEEKLTLFRFYTPEDEQEEQRFGARSTGYTPHQPPGYHNSSRSPGYSPDPPGYYQEPYDHDDDEQSYDDDGFIVGSTRNRSTVRSRSRSVSDVVEVVADDGDVERVFTLTDPDVLDCTICTDPLTVPVFQCENGHIACSSCSTKVRNKCPSCTLPIGYIRCRAVENILPKFMYRCFEKTSYLNEIEHEKTYTYAACSCSNLDCTFIGSLNQMGAHFTSEHPYTAKRFLFDNRFTIQINANEKYVLLQENGGQFFILNNMEFQSVGNVISVTCVKPSTSNDEFYYVVAAKNGHFVVILESVAVNVAKRVKNSIEKRFLMVPRDFISSCGKIEVEVIIMFVLVVVSTVALKSLCAIS